MTTPVEVDVAEARETWTRYSKLLDAPGPAQTEALREAKARLAGLVPALLTRIEALEGEVSANRAEFREIERGIREGTQPIVDALNAFINGEAPTPTLLRAVQQAWKHNVYAVAIRAQSYMNGMTVWTVPQQMTVLENTIDDMCHYSDEKSKEIERLRALVPEADRYPQKV